MLVLVGLLPLVGGRHGAAAPADDGEYTSPTYGYTITWDPAVWPNSNDYVGSFDSLTLQNELATVMLTGTNVHGDLPTCLAEGIAGFEIGELTPAEGIAGPTPAPGASAALMTTDLPADDGTILTALAYFECRWVEEGESTLMITLLAEADTFAEVLPLYEDLIAGLEISGASAPAAGPVTTLPANAGPADTGSATTGPGTTPAPGATTVAPSTSVAPVAQDTDAPPTSGQSGAPAAGYVSLDDATGLLTVEVPDTWTDVNLGPDEADDGTVRPMISASPNRQSFLETFDTPGLLYVAFPAGSDLNELLRFYDWPPEVCQDGGITPYDDGLFTGSRQTWTNCGSSAASVTFVAANPPTNDFTAWLYIQTVTPADDQALRHILDTFTYYEGVGLPAATAPGAGSTPSTSMPLTTAPSTTGPGANVPTSATSAGLLDPTSEAAATASMLQPADVSTAAETSGIGPDEDVDLPGWTENGGLRALSQTLSDDAITVFDFRWQFPDAVSAAAFLDAAEADLSEVSIGSVLATAPVSPVADTRYYTFSSNLFTAVVGFNYLMRHENIVAKVYVSGPEGEVTDQDAARIAQIAGERMIAAHSASTTPQVNQLTTTLPGAPTTTASGEETTITLSGLDQSGNPVSDTYTCTQLHDFVMNPDMACDELFQGLWNQIVAANPQAFQTFADLQTLGNFHTLPDISQQIRAWFGLGACVFRSASDYAAYDAEVRELFPAITPGDTQLMWDEAHRVLCPFVP